MNFKYILLLSTAFINIINCEIYRQKVTLDDFDIQYYNLDSNVSSTSYEKSTEVESKLENKVNKKRNIDQSNGETQDVKEKKDIEFCLYNYDGLTKIVNPSYTDSNNNTVYFDNIEEYAKFIGPTWFGVSHCGNNTLVNNIGVYYKVIEKKDKIEEGETVNENELNKRGESTDTKSTTTTTKKSIETNIKENITKPVESNLQNVPSVEEYKKLFKEKYENIKKNGLKCIALNSINPGYNPYHPALINFKAIDNAPNIVTVMGMPYGGNINEYMNVIEQGKDEEKDNKRVKHCGIVKNFMDGSLSCSVKISKTIEQSVTITDSSGVSYHNAYGRVVSEGSSLTEDINNVIELSSALTDSKSISCSTSKGDSTALESVYSIVRSQSIADTQSKEKTHTNTHDDSYAHTENEEHSHTRTKGGEHVDTHNWSESQELSHNEEYSRMDLNDYKKTKNLKPGKRSENFYLQEYEMPQKRAILSVLSGVAGIASTVANTYFQYESNQIAKKGNEIAEESNNIARDANNIAKDANRAAFDANDIAKDANRAAFDANDIAKDANKIAERANNIAADANRAAYQANDIARDANKVAREANDIARDANAIASWSAHAEIEESRKNRESSERIAYENSRQELRIAAAGTRSSSDTISSTKSNEKGRSDSTNWSDAYTNTSGTSNSWTTSNGYSDAYTMGHSETSSKELSESDSSSKMYTTTFNEESGWVNEYASTLTSSNSYAYGNSNTRTYNSDISYDEAIDKSAEKSHSNAVSISENREESMEISFKIPDNRCWNLTALPLFRSEVNVWACGEYDGNGELLVSYKKSIRPIGLLDFAQTPIACNTNQNMIDYEEYVLNDDKEKFIFIESSKKNALRSKNYLEVKNGIISESNKYIFGLLETGELVLCEGKALDNKCINNKLWTNGMNYIPKLTRNGIKIDYKFKLYLGSNGHLYVTAKHIFKSYNPNVKYADFSMLNLGNSTDTNDNNNNNNPKLERRKPRTSKGGDNLFNKETSTSASTTTTTIDNIIDTTTTTTTTNPNATTISSSNPTSAFINPEVKNNNNSDIPNNTSSNSSTTNNIKATNEATLSTEFLYPFNDNDDEYIIWDSLPKDLPFNVGFPDGLGYYLYIKDEHNSASVSVCIYDGVGVKIWEIRPGQETYRGYAFPREYNMPLAFDTPRAEGEISKYDKHNILGPKVKNTYVHSIDMNCNSIMKEYEALVSNNGKYKFFIQDTGNMVVKEGPRTMWSSMTANIGIFEGPFKLSFSPLGEFILRDKNDFALWHVINPLSQNNREYEGGKFKLVLSDEGELFVEDENNALYWSSWPVRKSEYNTHVRYIRPMVYEISSCNEKLRPKYIYNLFSSPELYNYYEDSENDKTFKNKYYVNNLLPGESLISTFGATLNVTDSDVLFYYNKNEKHEKIFKKIADCKSHSGIEELVLDVYGMKLICKDKYENQITVFDNTNPDTGKYARLSIEYRYPMTRPDIMIFNVVTWEPLWASDSVRHLHYIEESENPSISNHKIIVDKTFSTYDRMLALDGSDDFLYMSNNNGLEFKTGPMKSVRNITLKNNNLYMNDRIIIQDYPYMKMQYNGNDDKLVITNSSRKTIWELYANKTCETLTSSDSNCNTIYTNSLLYYNREKYSDFKYYLNKNMLFYTNSLNESEYYFFNISSYFKNSFDDSVYSISLKDNGDITMNDDKYTLHKEFFKPDPPYRLVPEGYNLVLYSNSNERKWGLNSYITNRPYDTNKLFPGDSFEEGEMLFCGNYSMSITNGKLLYRNHETLEVTEIDFGANYNTYLSYITITRSSLRFFDKNNKNIEYVESKYKSNSILRCELSSSSIVWEDGNGDILWSYPEFIPKPEPSPTTTKPVVTTTDVTSVPSDYVNVWLYNGERNSCLYAPKGKDEHLIFGECDNSGYDQWLIPPNFNGYFHSKVNPALCIRVKDINTGLILLGECDDKAKIYRSDNTCIQSILSDNLCLGALRNDNNEGDIYANLNQCNHNKPEQDQIWWVNNVNPWGITDSTTSTTKSTTKPTTTTTTKSTVKITTTTTTRTTTTTTTTTTLILSPTVPPNAKVKWFYNAYNNQCLSVQKNYGKKPLIRNCLNDDNFQWILYPSPKGYFHSKVNEDWCLNLEDIPNGKIKVKECNNNAIFEFTKEGLIKSPLSSDTCLGKGDRANDPTNKSGGYLNPCKKSGDQIWTAWDRNPSEMMNAKNHTVWIYNNKLKKCLYSGSKTSNRPRLLDCDNSDMSKWVIPISGDGFIKSAHQGWCLQVNDIDDGTIVMSENCTENSIFYDINSTYTKEAIISTLDINKCIGILSSGVKNEYRLNLNNCNRNKNEQHWEIYTEDPYAIRCGAANGNAKCPSGQCCSKKGICGRGDEYCDTGCQTAYGLCYTTRDSQCGPKYGICRDNKCCSFTGYCSHSNDFCSPLTCNPEYGVCH